MTETLRVAVIGAGRMGADHIQRLNTRIHGAEVAAVVDVDLARAQAAIEGIPGAVALADAEEALNNGDVNAVLIATPGFLHEDILLKAIAKDIPILCEKPLTPDAESSLEDRPGRGGAGPQAHPGRLHAPLRRRVRRPGQHHPRTTNSANC